MSPKKIFYVMIAILVIIVLSGVGVLYFGNSLMQKKAAELKQADLDNKINNKKLSLLQKAKKELIDNKDLQAAIDKILPTSKNQAEVVAQLYAMAAESGIQISNITFPSSGLGADKAAASSGSSSNTSSPAPTASSSSNTSQTKPVSGLSGVSSVDVTLTFAPLKGETIPYENMIKFLTLVESNRRTMLINTLQISPDLKSGGVNFSMTLKLFVKS